MTVIFTKAGLFQEKWSGKLQKDVRRRVKKMAVWNCLRDHCDVEEGVTLLDILRTVGQYKLLKVFVSQYSWCKSLEDFHAQVEEPKYEAEADDEKMDFLEVYWHADYDGKTLDISTSFHGIGWAKGRYAPGGEFAGTCGSPDGLIRWGIGFSTMNSLADLPVKLNEAVAFYKPRDYKNVTPIIKADRPFSLLDVLDAIYWEISFYGDPHEKNVMKDTVMGRVEDIKSGVCGIPGEKVFDLPDEGPPVILHPDVLHDLGLDPDHK